jgi:hypothetical protein
MLVLAFDIETEEFSKLNRSMKADMISVVPVEGDYRGKKIFGDIGEFLETVIDQKHDKIILYAHHLAFDFFYVLDYIRNEIGYEKIECIIDGGLLINAVVKIEEKELIFKDTYALFRSSLKKIGKAVGLEKLEMPDNFGEEMEEYCLRDSKIVKKALKSLCNRNCLETEYIPATAASLANRNFRSFLADYLSEAGVKKKKIREYIDPVFFDIIEKDDNNNFVFGGHTVVYNTGPVYITQWDIKSSYPYAASADLLPLCRVPATLKRNIEFNREDRGEEVFLIKAKAKVDCERPPFPWRYKGAPYYVNGEIEVLVEPSEMKFFEKKPFSVDFEIEGYFSAEHYIDLGPYFRRLFLIKENSRGFEKTYAKLNLNSGIGRWAQLDTGSTCYIRPFDGFEELNSFMGKQRSLDELGGNGVERNKSGEELFLIDKKLRFFITKQDKKIPVNRNVLWNSIVISRARRKLFEPMKRAYVHYTDTDSIFISDGRPPRPRGNNLGDWNSEFEGLSVFLGPKMYISQLEDKFYVKAKGFRDNRFAAATGEETEQMQVFGPKRYVKSDLERRTRYIPKRATYGSAKRRMIDVNEGSEPLHQRDILNKSFMGGLKKHNIKVFTGARDRFLELINGG